MKHITEARVIGSHAEMGAAQQKSDGPFPVRREETDTALSTWDSEGGRQPAIYCA